MGRLVRILTWNVHGCVGTDRRFDVTRVARALRQIDADVVALQEVGEIKARMPAMNQARALAELTGNAFVYGVTVENGTRHYGNAILSRYPIVGHRSYDISIEKKERRGCVRADVDFGDGYQLHVFNVHLGLTRHERRRQHDRLLSHDILEHAALHFPMVVCGDFNHWFPGPVRRMLKGALTDCAVKLGPAEPTFHSHVRVFRLDRVLVDDEIAPRRVDVLDLPATRSASDHLPVLATLELLTTARATTAPTDLQV